MQTGPAHLFTVDGQTFIPTPLVRGPWDHDLQHGGAVCGALGWATTQELNQADDGARFMLTRLVVEIMWPVPVTPLTYATRTDRHGRRSRVTSAELWDGDRLLAKASSQWVMPRPTNASTGETGPFTGSAGDTSPDLAIPLRPVVATDPGFDEEIGYPRPGFNCDVFEYRCLVGSTEEPGPATIWVRMTADLVENARPHPAYRLATLADLGNAVGWEPSPSGEPMVNPDVTLQLFRYPVGEWICLQSTSRATAMGVGMVETRLWDGNGQFGLTLSTTVESPIPLTVDLPSC